MYLFDDAQKWKKDVDRRLTQNQITRADLARELDVSRAMVTRLLNNAEDVKTVTIKRVEHAIEKLVRARSRTTKRGGTQS